MNRTGAFALACGLSLLGAGCGTRVSQREGAATAAQPASTDANATSGAEAGRGGVGGTDVATASPVDQSSATNELVPSAANEATGRGSSKPTGAPAASRDIGDGDPTATRSTPAGAPNSGGPASAVSPGAGKAAATPANPTTPAPSPAKSVIKIGSVGTHSGPVGGVLRGAIEALQVWQRFVNDRGGLDGHPVRILFVDDGGESARHLAAMRDLVERDKVIAFVQDSAPIGNGRSSIPYIESKRVPVIGSETGSPWFYDSPMYFPQAPSGYLAFYAGVASHARAVALGKKKLATIACAEVNACQDADSIYAKYAPAQGFSHVYRARASVTQPDFTAECLAARNAGADFLVFAADTASIGRATTSCSRQGYRPTVGLLMSMITDAQKKDPNLVGALGTSNIFPWFQDDTPATAEFHAAMAKYLPNGVLGIAHATAWTSAKLLEKAAVALPDPPSSEGILRNLWAMKNETLGGLTRVSFSEGRTAAKIVCWWDIQIQDSNWASADRFTQRCTEPPLGL